MVLGTCRCQLPSALKNRISDLQCTCVHLLQCLMLPGDIQDRECIGPSTLGRVTECILVQFPNECWELVVVWDGELIARVGGVVDYCVHHTRASFKTEGQFSMACYVCSSFDPQCVVSFGRRLVVPFDVHCRNL